MRYGKSWRIAEEIYLNKSKLFWKHLTQEQERNELINYSIRNIYLRFSIIRNLLLRRVKK